MVTNLWCLCVCVCACVRACVCMYDCAYVYCSMVVGTPSSPSPPSGPVQTKVGASSTGEVHKSVWTAVHLSCAVVA